MINWDAIRRNRLRQFGKGLLVIVLFPLWFPLAVIIAIGDWWENN